jgi:hypothetical protein
VKGAYGSGPYQPYFPDILTPIIFQEIDTVLDPDLEADITWSDPLLHDLVHFQPGLPPAETPGPFMESKPGICLYPATHLARLKGLLEKNRLSPAS